MTEAFLFLSAREKKRNEKKIRGLK